MAHQEKVQLVSAARRGAAQALWLHVPAQESSANWLPLTSY